MKINMILAADNQLGIGKKGDLAWHIKKDMKYFKDITSNTKDLGKHNAVIMGRKTWESIPSKFRPLPQRINCVLSRTLKTESNNSKIDNFVLYFNSVEHCLKELSHKENLENIFIIGGANLYNQLLDHPKLNKIYLTKIKGNHNCDVFFDGIPDNFELKSESKEKEDNGFKFRFQIYKKRA